MLYVIVLLFFIRDLRIYRFWYLKGKKGSFRNWFFMDFGGKIIFFLNMIFFMIELYFYNVLLYGKFFFVVMLYKYLFILGRELMIDR